MRLTAAQILADNKAEKLTEKAAVYIDKTKRGRSETAAELLTRANKILYGAGLIDGKLEL